MFIMTDDKHLVNTRYIRNVRTEGFTLNFIGSAGQLIGVKTVENEDDLDDTLGQMLVSDEAMAIDRVAFQLEDIELMLENICIQLHKDIE